MGISITLRGKHSGDRDTLIERAAEWLAARGDDPRPRVDRIDAERIAVELHPSAEAMLVTIDARSLVIDAATGSAGPGYHRHVCALARELAGVLGAPLTFARDETGWLAKEDAEALEAAFLSWLQGAASEILLRAREGAKGFALLMPEGWRFQHAGLVATPLGPRDEAWVRRVERDPRAGIDAFAWWSSERDARYYRNLACVSIWRDVRWRPPLDPEERALFDAIATWIEQAHAIDPELALPWVEQAELLELAGESSLRATRAGVKAHARGVVSERIGYRRSPVRVSLSGGFSLEVPGEMAEKWDERGTWVAWDRDRTIWFTSFAVEHEPGAPPSTLDTLAGLPPLTGEDLLEFDRGEIAGVAAFHDTEENGAILYRLDAHAAIGADAAVGTIVFAHPDDRRWALETWGSIDHESG